MRILSAFVLLAVLGGLAIFLTFSSSWGMLLASQVTEPTPQAEEPATPTPDWAGKLTADVSQAVVLRAAPVPSAPVVGVLRRGERVALLGCDADVLWCQTEDNAWLLAYMVDALPVELPILDHPGLTVKTAKTAMTPTPAPFTPPPPTPAPTVQSLALLLPTPTPAPAYIETTVNEKANLRDGPGTDFAIIGSANTSDIIQLTGVSADGEWYQLADGAWIAAFLVVPPVAPPPVVTPDSSAPVEDVSLIDVLTNRAEDAAPADIVAPAAEAEAAEEETAGEAVETVQPSS